jgi:hypothetical protein
MSVSKDRILLMLVMIILLPNPKIKEMVFIKSNILSHGLVNMIWKSNLINHPIHN